MATDTERPLAGLTRGNIARELGAGVTLLAIAVPLNIGYAQIAGLPPTAGLYALVLPTIVYALTVSSRQVVASPDAAAAALVASSLVGLAAAGAGDYATMALAQAILSGVMFVLASVFKLGFLASFLSKPILVGFVGGLALDILVSQVAKMLGVPIDSGEEFVGKLVGIVANLAETDAWSVAIAAGAVAILLIGRRIAPAVPWALVVLVLATALVVLASLDDAGVDVLGEVPAGPPTLTWPVLEWTTWLLLVPSALALTMVTTAEGLLVARSYAERRGYPDRPNRDLFAFGLGNIAAGASGGSRSAPPRRARRRWTRQARARSSRRSSPRPARCSCSSSARPCSPTSPRPRSAPWSRWRSSRCSASASSPRCGGSTGSSSPWRPRAS